MEYLFLSLVAFCAGIIDAIAGGGGLLVLPALLNAGIPSVAALATNKLQSAVGTGAACLNYARAGHVQPRLMLWPVCSALAGSLCGSLLVQHIGSTFLAGIVPVLLIGMAIYFLLSPSRSDMDRHQRIKPAAYTLAAAGVGFYDGFFGPGAGAFYTATMMSLLGFGVIRATANTKMLNMTSNLAALAMMIFGGHVMWRLGLCMAAANVAGSFIGSHLAMRLGSRLIRPLLITVSVAMSIKLLMKPDNPATHWLLLHVFK